jgi:hypothetical protein
MDRCTLLVRELERGRRAGVSTARDLGGGEIQGLKDFRSPRKMGNEIDDLSSRVEITSAKRRIRVRISQLSRRTGSP